MNKRFIIFTFFMAIAIFSCAGMRDGVVVAMVSPRLSGSVNTSPEVASNPGQRPTQTNNSGNNNIVDNTEEIEYVDPYQVVLEEPGYVIVPYNSPAVFRQGIATLTRTAVNVIDMVIDFMYEYPNARVIVEGHPDTGVNTQYNLTLIRARAISVYEYMISQGIASTRLLFYDNASRINNDNVSLGNTSIRFIIINDRESFSHYIDYARKYSYMQYPENNNIGPLPTYLRSPLAFNKAFEKKSDILTTSYGNMGVTIVVEDKPFVKNVGATSSNSYTNYKKSVRINFGVYKDIPYKTHALKHAALIFKKSPDAKNGNNLVQDNSVQKIKIARKTAEIASQMFYNKAPSSTGVRTAQANINAARKTAQVIAKIDGYQKSSKLTFYNDTVSSKAPISKESVKAKSDKGPYSEDVTTLKLGNPVKESKKKEIIKPLSSLDNSGIYPKEFVYSHESWQSIETISIAQAKKSDSKKNSKDKTPAPTPDYDIGTDKDEYKNRKKEEPLPPPPPPPEPIIEKFEYKVELADGLQMLVLPTPITFEKDSAVLDKKYERSIKYMTDYFIENPDYRAIVEGSSVENGSEEYNTTLARERAYSVYSEFIFAGIDRERVLLYGLGNKIVDLTKYQPINKKKDVVFIRIIIIKDLDDYAKYLDYIKGFGL